jgi:hypothetical protein
MPRDADSTMTGLSASELDRVCGGALDSMPNDNAFGRCGPGTSWKWLGDVYTPACKAHDASVRGALAQGSSHAYAHLQALPLLPAAGASYLRARL